LSEQSQGLFGKFVTGNDTTPVDCNGFGSIRNMFAELHRGTSDLAAAHRDAAEKLRDTVWVPLQQFSAHSDSVTTELEQRMELPNKELNISVQNVNKQSKKLTSK